MDYSFQLLNKNNFTVSVMLTIHKAWWVTHFCTLDWIFQIGKSDIRQVSLDMKDPNDSTLKLIMKALVSYYISWIMNITRHLKPKLLVHGPHTKTTEMGYKKSTSAQRNNSPCIRQLGNTGASTRAIRGKLDTTKLKWVRWRVSGSDCTTVAWLPISLSDKSFSQQVSGKTMYFISSNLIKEMCEDVAIAEVKPSSLHRLSRGDLCSHLQNCSCTIPL